MDMVYLRERVAEMEEVNDRRVRPSKTGRRGGEAARPAWRVGTFLMAVEPDKAHVCAGTDYVAPGP